MPNTKPDTDSLLHCIQQETELVSAFITLLEREADVLASGAEHAALEPITTQKNDYAEQLDRQARQRNAMLMAMDHGVDKDGLLAAVNDDGSLFEPVRQLLEHTARASMLNTGNGRIITRFLNHNDQALDVLRHLTGRSDLYDARGRKRPTAQSPTTHIKAS